VILGGSVTENSTSEIVCRRKGGGRANWVLCELDCGFRDLHFEVMAKWLGRRKMKLGYFSLGIWCGSGRDEIR